MAVLTVSLLALIGARLVGEFSLRLMAVLTVSLLALIGARLVGEEDELTEN